MKLELSTLAEVSAAVAQYCAGWTIRTSPDGSCYCYPPNLHPLANMANAYQIPPYAESADAVLALMETYGVMVERVCYEEWDVSVTPSDREDDGMDHSARSTAPTFPLAACLALLRAHGHTVSFSPEGKA